MSLTINREIFERVKAVIAQTGRINMLSWAKSQASRTPESVDEIRGLLLLDDCRMTACIGGLICHLATSEEIARAAEIYGLSDNEVQEPSILSVALLLDGAEDQYELENACLPLFSLIHWPLEEQSAYSASQSNAEKNRVVIRRMDNWAMEIEALKSIGN
ncbi:MAG: hypothetical protein HONDAALG_03854 [Gammaproteobacteria bacterium]|nr:hypothetical protein [Gammaproteobacteria bacterium]